MTDLDLLRGLVRSAQISDCLDAVGLRHQNLAPEIVPLDPGMRMVGRAFTVRAELASGVPERPYTGMLRALDALDRDDIYVIPSPDGATMLGSCWGELLSTWAMSRGCAGMVTDGAVRDVDQVRALGYPTFAVGTTPRDINGRYEVIEHQVPVLISGVLVHPGDLIVGDVDGVVVVPQSVEAEVVAAAVAKASGENTVRDAIVGGMTPSQAFDKYGIL